MMRRINLDTGHLTDEELGLNKETRRQMLELPTSNNERKAVRLTPNGNFIVPVKR